MLQFFGFREQPFGVTPDPGFLFFRESHRAAVAALCHGIESGRGFISLIAPPGMGKTTLLYFVLSKYRDSAQTAFHFQTQCNSRELLRYLLNDLGINVERDDVVAMHESFRTALARETQAGKRTILIIDEAHNLPEDALETLRLLSNFETSKSKLLQIILAGQTELAAKLDRPSMAQLRQRISIMCQLSPLSADEVEPYIERRLKAAGHEGKPLFAPRAIALIAALSDGVPRNVNNYCHRALLRAAERRQERVDEGVVQEVAREMRWGSGERAPAAEPAPAPPAQLEPVARDLTARPVATHRGAWADCTEDYVPRYVSAANMRERWMAESHSADDASVITEKAKNMQLQRTGRTWLAAVILFAVVALLIQNQWSAWIAAFVSGEQAVSTSVEAATAPAVNETALGAAGSERKTTAAKRRGRKVSRARGGSRTQGEQKTALAAHSTRP